MKWFGGIEAGGTKFNCIIAQDPEHILVESTIPTQTPQVTIPEVIRFFKESEASHGIHLEAMGVIELHEKDPVFVLAQDAVDKPEAGRALGFHQAPLAHAGVDHPLLLITDQDRAEE